MGILYGPSVCLSGRYGDFDGVLLYGHTWFHEDSIHQSCSVKGNDNVCIIKHLNLCWIILHQFSVIVGIYLYDMFRKHQFLTKTMQCRVRLCGTTICKTICVSNLCAVKVG